MKRKILSLALALMMIVSVAAALPVSASSNDFVIEGSDIATKVSGSDTIYSAPTAEIASSTNADWANDGYAQMNHYSTGVDYTVDIPATGAYKITVAAATTQTGANVPHIRLKLNGNALVNFAPLAATGTSNVVQGVEIGTAYMVAENDATINVKVTNETFLYGIKFEYMGATASFGYSLNARKDMTRTGSLAGNANKTITGGPSWLTLNFDETTSGSTVNYHGYLMNNSTLTATVNLPIDGYYNFYVAGGADAAKTAKITVDSAYGTVSMDATQGVGYPVASTAYRTYLNAGEHTLTVGNSTSNIYTVYYEYDADQSVADMVFDIYNDKDSVSNQQANLSTATTLTPTADWIPATNRKGYRLHSSATNGGTTLTYTATIVVPGYYDVYVGASTQDAAIGSIGVEVDGNVLSRMVRIDATADNKTVGETYVGSIWLTAGDHTIVFKSASSESSKVNLYNYMLSYAGTAKTEFIFDAEMGTVSGGEAYTHPGYTATSNDASWVDNSACVNLRGVSTISYSFYVAKTGDYSVSLAYAQGGAMPLTSVTMDGTELLSEGFQPATENEYTVREYAIDGTVTLTAGNTYTVTATAGNAFYIYGVKVALSSGGSSTPVVPDEITLVNASGTALTASDIAQGTEVYAKAVMTKTASIPANATIIIAQYTDNTATKTMAGSPVMESVTLSDGQQTYTSTQSLTIAANCTYVQAFLWTADGKYIPLLAGASLAAN